MPLLSYRFSVQDRLLAVVEFILTFKESDLRNMMLCENCISITLKALREKPGYPHSTSFNALEISSRTCPLCALLWNSASNCGIFNQRSIRANSEDTVYLQVNESDDDDSLLRQISIVTLPEVLEEIPEFTTPGFLEHFGEVALYADANSPAENIINVQRVAFSSNSDAAFEMVHRRLWNCSTNHPRCPILPTAYLKYVSLEEDLQLTKTIHEDFAKESKKLEKLGVLPSRVLDVGPPDGSQEPFLRLFNKPTTGFWIALSHCWGTLPLLRTTTETIAEHISGIPMSHLPPSFRDAVTITRRLGVRYLWIDALCIIQDDLEDWRVESAQMSRIYGMSFLTIIAAGASNSHGGCFIPRSVRFPPAYLHPSDSPGPFYVTEFIEDSGASVPIRFGDREPTDQRGWCFQEALLPNRSLYYGTKMMTWRCKNGCFSEQGNSYSHKSAPMNLYHELEQPFYGYRRWDYILQEYTQRSLTHEKDRLIALAGIAEVLSEIWDDTYLAGLWRGDLVRQLLWQTDGHSGTLITRPREFIAPTWSWAAVKGPIRSRAHWLKDYEPVTSVIQAEVIPLGNNTFGNISSGAIKLEGPIERVLGNWEFLDDSLAIVTSGPDSRKHLMRKTTCFLDVPEERDWLTTELWCLRVVSKLHPLTWEEPDPGLNVWAILLIPTGRREDEFFRVGIAKLNFDPPQTSRVTTLTII